MVQALRALMDFIYIARRDIIDSDDLTALDNALERFHNYRTIFQECGIRPTGFNLPRQHSLIHYHSLIRSFGAPNGLCSSITESKHIKAVKSRGDARVALKRWARCSLSTSGWTT
jgi:hypothetical protein